jgi:hypothetical protein
MTRSPYLSVVVTARNDDHGGDPLYRMQIFIDSLCAQCDAHALPAELVIVEWNPPADRPRLADVLCWPEDEGIRRARGAFVLATNIDVLFDDRLMHHIAAGRLQPGFLYRVDRYDVPGRVETEHPSEWIAWCRGSVMRLHIATGSIDRRTGMYYPIGSQTFVTRFVRTRIARSPAAHRRLVAFRTWLHERLAATGWAGGGVHRAQYRLLSALRNAAFATTRAFDQAARTTHALLWACWAVIYWIWCGLREPRIAPRRILRRLRRLAGRAGTGSGPLPNPVSVGVRTEPVPASVTGARGAWEIRRAWLPLHTNASGDFTLMARDDWERVQGYAELQRFSMHIDGLLLYQAHWAGIRERRLPYPIYHLEHGSGFRPDTASVKELNDRLERTSISQITFEELAGWIVAMRAARAPLPFNDANWGFGDAELAETDPVAAKVASG